MHMKGTYDQRECNGRANFLHLGRKTLIGCRFSCKRVARRYQRLYVYENILRQLPLFEDERIV